MEPTTLIVLLAIVLALAFFSRRSRRRPESPSWFVGTGSQPYLPPGDEDARRPEHSDRPFMPRRSK